MFTDGDWVESKDQDPGGSIRLTQLADIGEGWFRDRSDRWLNESQARRLGVTYLEAGDVLIARMPAPLGRACVFPGLPTSAITVVDVSILRIRHHNPRWVAIALNAPQSRRAILSFQAGSTRKRISRKNLGQIEIPVPHRRLQDELVDSTDSLLSRLDAAVGDLERGRTRLAQARSATLKAAVEGRLVPTEADLARAEGRDYEHASVLLARIIEERRARHEAEQAGAKRKKKYQEPVAPEVEGLPELPEGWVWATVEQLGRVQTGSTPPTGHAGHYAGPEGLPFIKPSELDFPDPVGAARSFLSEKGTRLARPLPPLSVLVTCIGATIGKTGLVRSACATNQQINAVVPERAIRETRFIHVAFISPLLQESILANASATTLPILNKSRFSSLAVPLPPLAEQHRIVAELDRRLSILFAIEATIDTNRARCARLRQAILKAAFEGRLVSSDDVSGETSGSDSGAVHAGAGAAGEGGR